MTRALPIYLAALLLAACGPDDGPTGADAMTGTGADAMPPQPDAEVPPTCADLTCDPHASCDDSGAMPVCVCDAGWTGDGTACTDIDECAGGVDDCDANATCTNTDGSFTCACNSGWTGDGTICTDVDECAAGTDDCDANATCTDTEGSFTCACNTGWTGDGTACTDLDECAAGTDDCDANATCTNTEGSFTCACDWGYEGDGTSCTDIDECAAGTDTCDANAICGNIAGGYTCTCTTGWTGDGTTCTDIDECATGAAGCHAAATCANTPGGYTCSCNTGYSGDGFTCTDIDECTAGTDTCHADATCTNTVGAYTCACNSGWAGDGFTCTDIDECTAGTDTCDPNASCANTGGSYTCTCIAGWTGDGFTCTDIDECAGGMTCDVNASCSNEPGSYSCACNVGFQGDGFVCTSMFGPPGHVVLIGHDFYERNADLDKIIGNAVLLANTTGVVQVLGFQQYADTTASGEVANTNAGIQARATALGRSVTITPLSDYTQLDVALAGKHVLVIYEKEIGGDSTAIGLAWRKSLTRFMARGGVVIALDYYTDGWQILSTAGLLAVTGRATGYWNASTTVSAPADPVMAGVADPYIGTNGSTTYAGITEGVTASTYGGEPVVIHKTWPCALVGEDGAGYVACIEYGVTATPCDDISATGAAACSSDDCTTPVALPFTFDYYGVPRTGLSVISNGKLGFPGSTSYTNSCTIEADTIAPYWDDLYPPLGGQVSYQTVGIAPVRRFVAQWNVSHIALTGSGPNPYDIRAVLYETTNDIVFCYVDTDAGRSDLNDGVSATIGVSGSAVDEGVNASCNEASVSAGTVIRFYHP